MPKFAFARLRRWLWPVVALLVMAVLLAWLLLITLGHVQLNVGWGRLADEVRVLLGAERKELVVGFLPVT